MKPPPPPCPFDDAPRRIADILRENAIGAMAGGTVCVFTATEVIEMANELDPKYPLSPTEARTSAKALAQKWRVGQQTTPKRKRPSAEDYN